MELFPETLDLAQLSERAEVSPRTVRYYIQQGLLPSPESRGPGAHYGREHLDRLRLIRRLQRQHLPLAEIRQRLESMSAEQIRQAAEAVKEGPSSSARDYIREALSEGPSRLSYADAVEPQLFASHSSLEEPRSRRPGAGRATRSQWDRFTLAQDVELHVRRPLSREQNRQVERLLEAARNIFEEEGP